ncbi:MAG: hypothetical protein ACR2PX_00680 [Endozoicomonas sp.]|uniref:hypothetical protein n=1 Tax=Endozoicomonas sp. TaxID=1892382 RepID=UPI003D9B459A
MKAVKLLSIIALIASFATPQAHSDEPPEFRGLTIGDPVNALINFNTGFVDGQEDKRLESLKEDKVLPMNNGMPGVCFDSYHRYKGCIDYNPISFLLSHDEHAKDLSKNNFLTSPCLRSGSVVPSG